MHKVISHNFRKIIPTNTWCRFMVPKYLSKFRHIIKPANLRRFGRFEDTCNVDHTYLIISTDKKHLQCLSNSNRNSFLCGRKGMNLPDLDGFTPALVFKGASFRPRDGRQAHGETGRSRYNWAATHYGLMGRMAACNWLGEYIRNESEKNFEMLL